MGRSKKYTRQEYSEVTDYAYDFAPTITFFGDRIDDDEIQSQKRL